MWWYHGGMEFTLRLPDELYKKLKEYAAKEQRSLNAQIVYILLIYIEKLEQKKQQG